MITEWNVHTITNTTAWVTALNQIEAAIKNDAVTIFYYSLAKNTSSVGASGILNSDLSGNLLVLADVQELVVDQSFLVSIFKALWGTDVPRRAF